MSHLLPLRLFIGLVLATGAAHAIEPKDIKPAQELVITDLAVVESPEASANGRFSLEFLLQGLAPDGKAKTALLGWLRSWTSLARNGQPKQIGADLIREWKKRDGNENLTDAAWEPNFTHAPFRLLAITNRLDLQRRDVDGIPLHAGEGRFVFGLTTGDGPAAGSLPGTVIFEYELVGRSESDVLTWAQQWHDLGSAGNNLVPQLVTLTEQFTKRGAAPLKTNGSAINQVRTNEIALTGDIWNLQEFRLDPASGAFFTATTKQTPATAFETSAITADYINSHEADIMAQRHTVPRFQRNVLFLGKQSNVPFPPLTTIVWKPSPVLKPEARYLFALNTCNGCHGAEAQTDRFTHIAPREKGTASELSAFLRDLAPQDPATGWVHDELREITARQKIMAAVLSQTPPTFLTLSPQQRKQVSVRPSDDLLVLLAARAGRHD